MCNANTSISDVALSYSCGMPFPATAAYLSHSIISLGVRMGDLMLKFIFRSSPGSLWSTTIEVFVVVWRYP